MPRSIRKILFNKPWLLPILAFLCFVAVWVSFIAFAISNRPPEVERVFQPVSRKSGGH